MINELPPFNRGYNMDPNMKALKRRGLINHVSTLGFWGFGFGGYSRSPGTHIVGPWVPDIIQLYRDLRTGTQYVGNWASRVTLDPLNPLNPKP